MFDNKKILITGGTGSLGQALTKKLLSLNVDTIRIFSRNEHKQIDMESKFNDKRLRFLLGDIRDLIASDHRVDQEVTQMVHLVGFKQSSIDINLYYFTKTTDWEEWRSTVEDHILSFVKIIAKAGASMAFPTQSIHVEGLPEGFNVTGVVEKNVSR